MKSEVSIADAAGCELLDDARHDAARSERAFDRAAGRGSLDHEGENVLGSDLARARGELGDPEHALAAVAKPRHLDRHVERAGDHSRAASRFDPGQRALHSPGRRARPRRSVGAR